MDQRVPAPFRYPLPTREDLPALSRLAYRISATECAGCRNYHVTWPYLRSIGANGGGPEFNWSDQRAIVAGASAGRRHVRWFLAGSADAGQLAMVAEAMKAHPAATYDVTIVDRCATPLALCREHAAAESIALETIQGELDDYVAAEGFDVVLMHHTIVFVPPPKRAAFIKNAARWLAPDGRLVMTLSLDAPGEPVAKSPNLAMAAWREQLIRDAVADGELELPEDIETFIGRVVGMRDPSRGAMQSHRAEDYYAAIEEAGFAIERLVTLEPEADDELLAQWRQRERAMLVASRSSA